MRYSLFLCFVTILILTVPITAITAEVNYSYDNAGRLIRADYGDKVITYTYDNNGNLLLKKISNKMIIEEYSEDISYVGSWKNISCDACSGGSLKYSDEAGAWAGLRFYGTDIIWIYTKADLTGIANIYIDNILHDTIDLYSEEFQYGSSTVISGLDLAWHTIRIEVTGTKKEVSKSTYITIDAFEVLE